MPFNSESAKVAANNRKTPGRKGNYDAAWIRLGGKITGAHATKINSYMNRLWKEGNEAEFFDGYLKLLQYFKPKIQAHAIKQQTEITIKIGGADSELFEDI